VSEGKVVRQKKQRKNLMNLKAEVDASVNAEKVTKKTGGRKKKNSALYTANAGDKMWLERRSGVPFAPGQGDE